jgi:hypothetical protein
VDVRIPSRKDWSEGGEIFKNIYVNDSLKRVVLRWDYPEDDVFPKHLRIMTRWGVITKTLTPHTREMIIEKKAFTNAMSKSVTTDIIAVCFASTICYQNGEEVIDGIYFNGHIKEK